MPERLSFLLSRTWWTKSFELIKPLLRRFAIPAFLMVASNICAILCTVWSETSLKSGLDMAAMHATHIDPGSVGGTTPDLSTLLSAALGLLATALLGSITGLVALTLWLYDLTALCRHYFLEGAETFKHCQAELKKQSKYLTTVWLIGALYVLVPAIPMSVLLSFTVISNLNLNILGEVVLSLPAPLILPMNLAAAFLFLLTIDYSIALTALSSTSKLKPKRAAQLSASAFGKHLFELGILNCVLLILDVLISAPFSLCSILPQFASLSKNITFGIVSQVWFGFTSIITWPLTVLFFAEFLQSVVGKSEIIGEAVPETNSKPEAK